MPVPAKRRSRSKKRRGWAHAAIQKHLLVACGQCKRMVNPHVACPFCGSYKGRAVVKHRPLAERRSAKAKATVKPEAHAHPHA